MWKEIIRIRTRTLDIEKTNRVINDFFDMQAVPGNLAGYHVYKSATHQNETMLEIDWDAPAADIEGSELANNLVFSMKNLGMVNLSIWHEMEVLK
jgi:hypothetical protein